MDEKENVIYVYIHADKHTYTHTHTGISLSHKKEWDNAIWTNMGGLGGRYAKWNKSDRERQILYDITHIWHLKIQHTSENNKIRSRLTDIEKKILVTR